MCQRRRSVFSCATPVDPKKQPSRWSSWRETSRVQLLTGVLPIYTRTPARLAMTAAGLDYVSDGRFTLGIDTSGPQVVEGFHGVPFDAPLGRTREGPKNVELTVEIAEAGSRCSAPRNEPMT